MMRIGRATTQLNLESGTVLVLASHLEVSLDCVDCRRMWRTVFFFRGRPAQCTSKHVFDGALLELSSTGGELCARFSYRCEPFIDAKYPTRSQSPEFGAPTWVRFSFTLTCGACGRTSTDSTQSNMSRPWTKRCECGARLYDDVNLPQLSWREQGSPVTSRPATPAELAILISILREVGATDEDVAGAAPEAVYDCQRASYDLCFTPLHDMVEGRPYKRWRVQYHADGRAPSVAFLLETRRQGTYDTLPGGAVLRGSPWKV